MKIILAKPRGFCAGVERAIKCVERALARYGAPVYVLNDIVHNSNVVSGLRDKGAIFVKGLQDVPRGSHLLFSAHGVGPDRWEKAEALDLEVVDATCPLVNKVHNEASRFAKEDYTVILIGEPGHDETEGTLGWAPDHIKRIMTAEDVDALTVPDESRIAFITQTTLSVDDCEKVIDALRRRFPKIVGPRSDDICYATQNRQSAVNALSPEADLVLVVGDRASANSTRLANICRAKGKPAYLISNAGMIEEAWFEGVETVLLTSGASAPETLVQGVVDYLREREDCEVEERVLITEDVHFMLPQNIA